MAASSALKVQWRVLWALMLREIHTLYGGSYLGYLWVIIQGAFSVGVFWALRETFHFRAPHGMPTPAFLIVGFGIWHIFNGVINKSIVAVSGNKTLLTFPQVTPLDLMLARTLIVVSTEIIVAAIMLLSSVVLGYNIGPISWSGVMAGLFYISVISFGLGSILATLCYIIPTVAKIVPMVLRILFFCSGVFFSIDRLPNKIYEMLKWNPVLQLIEYTRNSLAHNYNAATADFSYLATLTIFFLFFGLLLERYGRRYLAEAQ